MKLTPTETFLDTCQHLPKLFLTPANTCQTPAATCRVVWCACKQLLTVLLSLIPYYTNLYRFQIMFPILKPGHLVDNQRPSANSQPQELKEPEVSEVKHFHLHAVMLDSQASVHSVKTFPDTCRHLPWQVLA